MEKDDDLINHYQAVQSSNGRITIFRVEFRLEQLRKLPIVVIEIEGRPCYFSIGKA